MSKRIATKCPACRSSTLVIGDGNWLVCSLIGCPDPTRINSVGDRADSHFEELQTLRDERDRLREALEGILDIGKRDMTNPKYDGYFEAARAALTPAEGGRNESESW